MPPVAINVARSVICVCMCVCVCVCVCAILSVGHTNVLCKNGWTDRDAVWVADSGWPKEPCGRRLSGFPHRTWQFWGLSSPLKSIRSRCCGVRSKKNHSVMNNDTTCDAAFRQKSLTTCYMLYVVDKMNWLIGFWLIDWLYSTFEMLFCLCITVAGES